MELSVFTAKVLALVYLSAGVAALQGRVSFAKIVEDFESSPALTFVSGFFTLVIGALLVRFHNIWAWDWVVMVTLIGWAALFKGILLIGFPQSIVYFKGWYKNERGWGILMLSMGLLFGCFGFFLGN